MSTSKLQFTPGEAALIADLSVRDVQKAFDEDWFDVVPRNALPGAARRWLGPAEVLHLRLVKDTCRHAVFLTEAKKLIHRQLRDRIVDLLVVCDDRLLVIEAKWPSDREQTIVGRGADSSLRDAGEWPSSDQQSLLDGNGLQRSFTIDLGKNEWGRLRSWFAQMAQHLKAPIKISEISLDAEGAWGEMSERLADATAAQFAVVSDPEIRGGELVVRGTRIPAHLLQDLVVQGATQDELLADYPSLDDQRLRLALLYAETHPRPGRPRKRPWQDSAVQ
jgi:uncharacterized protein (DUF433 family)